MPDGPRLPLLRSFLTSLGEKGLAKETIRLVGADIRALEVRLRQIPLGKMWPVEETLLMRLQEKQLYQCNL